jgi:hypothetical protein
MPLIAKPDTSVRQLLFLYSANIRSMIMKMIFLEFLTSFLKLRTMSLLSMYVRYVGMASFIYAPLVSIIFAVEGANPVFVIFFSIQSLIFCQKQTLT